MRVADIGDPVGTMLPREVDMPKGVLQLVSAPVFPFPQQLARLHILREFPERRPWPLSDGALGKR